MNKVSKAAAAVALAFGMAAPASAGVTLMSGDFKITFNAYDAGTVGYVPGNQTTICNSAAQCDAVVQDTNGDGVKDYSPNGVGSEDTWGIFSVQSITNIKTGDAFFTRGVNGYLVGMFGGLVDESVDVYGVRGGFKADTYANGGWLNMYLTSQDYDPTKGPSGRLGEFGYDGVTNTGGELVLSADFAGTADRNAPGYSYFSSFSLGTIFGNGAGFLDVTGGKWADKFDQNSVKDALGQTRDLSLKATYQVPTKTELSGWTVDATGDVQGAIPEPGSLALLGLGFAGLAGLRRRRAAK